MLNNLYEQLWELADVASFVVWNSIALALWIAIF